MKLTKTLIASIIAIAGCQTAIANSELDALLKSVAENNAVVSATNKQREQQFNNNKAQQQQLLEQTVADKQAQEAISSQLESDFEANEITLAEKKETLDKRLGSLKELFGVVQGATGDFSSTLQLSLTNTHIAERQTFLLELNNKMAKSTQLPEISELEKLWLEMQREMTESGKIVQFEARIAKPNGENITANVTRVGAFNLISDGQYLQYLNETGKIVVLGRQPAGAEAGANALESFDNQIHSFAIDPTGAKGGSLLSALINSPSLTERFHQGGVVGYAISIMALLGVLLSLLRFAVLTLTEAKVKKQLKQIGTITLNNPLGRVLDVYQKAKHLDADALELRVSEVLTREVPKLNSGLNIVKFMAMVAPLMGLLGTVIGMILTFQAITLFGTGDPKTMAGGISSALITTVLGLLAAIPMLFAHSILVSKAKGISNIIEQQAIALIAKKIEDSKDKSGAEQLTNTPSKQNHVHNQAEPA